MHKKGRDFTSDSDPHAAQAPPFDSLQQFISAFQEMYSVDLSSVLSSLQKVAKPQGFIPVSVFSERLSSLEAIVKYLKENEHLTLHEIAQLLSRNDRTIWATYQKARSKQKTPFNVGHSSLSFPASILQNRELSVLENIVSYFKDQGLSLRQIGLILKRDERNVWTVYSRAKKKWQRKQ